MPTESNFHILVSHESVDTKMLNIDNKDSDSWQSLQKTMPYSTFPPRPRNTDYLKSLV